MALTYEKIASTTLNSNTTNVTFSGIPSTYTDLVLIISVRSSTTAGDMRFRVNGNTGSIYSRTNMYSSNTTTYSATYTGSTGNNIMSGNFNISTDTTDIFTPIEIYLPNYLSSTKKPSSIFGSSENNGTAYMYAEAYLANETNAVTSINLVDTSTSGFAANSSFYLYGIKKA